MVALDEDDEVQNVLDRPRSPSQPGSTDEDGEEDEEEEDEDQQQPGQVALGIVTAAGSAATIVHANVAALSEDELDEVEVGASSLPQSQRATPLPPRTPEVVEVVEITLDRPPEPLPPKRIRRFLSQPNSQCSTLVHFDDPPKAFHTPQQLAANQLVTHLRLAGRYFLIVVAYLLFGSVLLLIMWRGGRDSSYIRSQRTVQPLLDSLWNITIQYNIFDEHRWKTDARRTLLGALDRSSSTELLFRPESSWTSAFLICASLVFSTGIADQCTPMVHRSLPGHLFSIVYLCAGIPLFAYVQWKCSEHLLLAIDSQSSQLAKHIKVGLCVGLVVYIFAFGPLLGDGLYSTLLVLATIGPLRCHRSSWHDPLAIMFYLVGYHGLALCVRVAHQVASKRSPEYANVKFDRQLASRSFRLLRQRVKGDRR